MWIITIINTTAAIFPECQPSSKVAVSKKVGKFRTNSIDKVKADFLVRLQILPTILGHWSNDPFFVKCFSVTWMKRKTHRSGSVTSGRKKTEHQLVTILFCALGPFLLSGKYGPRGEKEKKENLTSLKGMKKKSLHKFVWDSRISFFGVTCTDFQVHGHSRRDQ